MASGQTYVVPTSGLQVGGTVYRDRSYTFKTVPSTVQGAAYIQTANNDKAATNSNFLSFTVNEPVSVYVAHGDRITSKPSWLSTFTDTGANLVTSDATFSLFVRAFPAGTITLGGNASGGCCSMYSVIVKSGSGGTTTTSTTTTPTTSTSSSSLSISNLTVASGQTYVVPTSGLQVGGTVYRDRSYTFKTVPSTVQGAAYIQTANNDKAATNSNFLSFTVNEPVSVYVAHGDRITSKPSWLSTFTDTGANLVTSDATFSLFVRAFPAGTITLGGNASGGCCSMYSVIVKSGSGGTTTTSTTTTPTTTTPTTTSPTPSSSSSSDGDTYFVAASNGNDGNRGTLTAPFLTLERGLDVLLPGDTLYIRAGTYLGSNALVKIPNGNSWSEPVTIKAYGKERVVFTARESRPILPFRSDNEYIIIDGIVFDATGGTSCFVSGSPGSLSHHIRILNSECKNSYQSGILIRSTSHHFELINLNVHHTGSRTMDHGMYIEGYSNLVRNSAIHHNSGRGISLHGPKPVNVNDNRVIGNKIYDNTKQGILITGGPNNAIFNNLVWGNEIGIQVDFNATSTKVYNNTSYGNRQDGIYLGSDARNSLVMNNILSSNGRFEMIIVKGSGNSQVKNNLIVGKGQYQNGLVNNESLAILSNNLVGEKYDPKFYDVGNRNFHLTGGSPAIKEGLNISEVKDDFDGVLRPEYEQYEIGAYQYVR
ncbi:MAG: right-handed parallel beta-helix repeat-containing protein [Nitrospirales bacterium]|nr:right-handed parallel beta-helix repeat-containing protein [Nitrospirales bacterium]